MTPQEFIRKWKGSTLRERQAAQEHFLDICRMLGQPTPADVDPHGDFFCFERGAKKTGGGDGWADVWRRGAFGWEYKGKHKNLDAAFAQLQRYAIALENPPLLVVSDMERIRIHTNWTNTVSVVHEFTIDELTDPDRFAILRAMFVDPEILKPSTTTADLTEEAARGFADIAQDLRKRGHSPETIAHFLNRLLFCLFAEDVDLLSGKLFAKLLDAAAKNPSSFSKALKALFAAMRDGGMFGVDEVAWFNGGLFDTDDVLPLEREEVLRLQALSKLNWSGIEPSIFGTLFERGLDPSKRSQLGAHYTDPSSIMRLVTPVLVNPLAEEWVAVRQSIEQKVHTHAKLKDSIVEAERRRAATAFREAMQAYQRFLLKLRDFRVLDPACGSGNFLYLSLLSLKDIEHRAMLDAEVLGFPIAFPEVGPQCVMGIELNSYAAELARVTIWIGEIQWMRKHGFNPSRDPILRKLEQVECRDAIIANDGNEAQWPRCDVIVGNPPFLGDKKMRGELGDQMTNQLRERFEGRVPGGADFVTFWFEKARASIASGACKAAGLVATNSIRGGANRRVLDRIVDTTRIFEAWSDEPWINEGAAVRVSFICFGDLPVRTLDGKPVEKINADLSPNNLDLTKARKLKENKNCCFYATVKAGKFDVDGETARRWLKLPNPHGRPNADVVKPWINAIDITRRPSDKWVVDFGVDMPLEGASLYEKPAAHVVSAVKPERDKTRRESYRKNWWLFAEPIPGMRNAIALHAPRYIATPALAKHRLFVWVPMCVVPDHAVMVVARSDATTFGVLHSRFHEIWSLRMGTSLEDRPRYTPTSTFETFPFPVAMTPVDTASAPPKGKLADAIAVAADRLNSLRENWLNPPEWVNRVPEVVSGYPDRIVPKPGFEADLKARTLTNLYNTRPAWLVNAHRVLDAVVAAAYGWDDYVPGMTDEEILSRLLKLNLSRAA